MNYYKIPQSEKHYVTESHKLFEQVGESPDPLKDKEVATYSNSGKFRATIKGHDGKRYTITPENIILNHEDPFHAEPLTLEEILYKEHAVPIEPLFPDYAITEDGMLYCIIPPQRGKWAGRLYVKASSVGDDGVERVSLKRFDGKYTTATIAALVKAAWGSPMLSSV